MPRNGSKVRVFLVFGLMWVGCDKNHCLGNEGVWSRYSIVDKEIW
jgi:hypothetical protein